jgi:hypothetical protein
MRTQHINCSEKRQVGGAEAPPTRVEIEDQAFAGSASPAGALAG